MKKVREVRESRTVTYLFEDDWEKVHIYDAASDGNRRVDPEELHVTYTRAGSDQDQDQAVWELDRVIAIGRLWRKTGGQGNRVILKVEPSGLTPDLRELVARSAPQ